MKTLWKVIKIIAGTYIYYVAWHYLIQLCTFIYESL